MSDEIDPIDNQEKINQIKLVLESIPALLALSESRAKIAREYFNNLVKEGFTDPQAIDIVSKTNHLSSL